MTITYVAKDPRALTLTITTQYAAPASRVWRLFEDPRLLERWWGPPSYPATVVIHELEPGGRVRYYMSGPEGDQPHGWWRILEVGAPRRLAFENGLADEDGEPKADTPFMVVRVALDESPEGVTSMQVETTFPSAEAMEMFLSMGMEEGMVGALGQTDALLA